MSQFPLITTLSQPTTNHSGRISLHKAVINIYFNSRGSMRRAITSALKESHIPEGPHATHTILLLQFLITPNSTRPGLALEEPSKFNFSKPSLGGNQSKCTILFLGSLSEISLPIPYKHRMRDILKLFGDKNPTSHLPNNSIHHLIKIFTLTLKNSSIPPSKYPK